MTRQYTGARYVPRFTGLYNPTQSYEALDVVDNGSGTSYIAKIPTPANTPLTNTDYWFLYGSTSGAIVNLQQQIIDMKDGTVPGSLQEQIDTNTSNITALTNETAALKNGTFRRWAIITDSYGDTQGGTIIPFPRKFADYMGLTENVDMVFAHINGAGFIANTTTFIDVIDDLYNNMPSGLTADDITDLIIAGGSNDYNISSGLPSAISTTVAHAKSLFPNATIYIAMIGGKNNLSGRQQLLKNVIPPYMDCGRSGAKPLQYTYLAMTKKDNYLSDNIHPNQKGSNEIAGALISALFGGYTLNDFDSFTLTDYNGTFTANYANVRVYNDRMGILLNNGQYRKPTAQNIPYGNLTIALFDSNYLFGNAQLWGHAWVIYVGGTDDGKRFELPLVYSNGEIILVLPATVNVEGFNIPSAYLEVPIMNS